ncbi:MAG: hypothetical protein JSU81_05085 [Candidatus Coatesbacteria bacterium]|nr:MAG: hypothetical protein JSU81_05085 [Candidatus Coatesbacteria bacterium]
MTKWAIVTTLLALAAAAGAVDVNVADDEAKKAEAVVLTPGEGEGYYDSVALAELELAQRRRSPTGALWRSFALPGWGQIYNEQYVKAGVMMAAEAGTLYMAIDNYLISRKYLREARAAPSKEERAEKLERREQYIVETEFWGWLFVGALAFSMMDAYVDAHLADWDVSDLPADEEASSRLHLTPYGLGLAVTIDIM